jgi:hypothetical protein
MTSFFSAIQQGVHDTPCYGGYPTVVGRDGAFLMSSKRLRRSFRWRSARSGADAGRRTW